MTKTGRRRYLRRTQYDRVRRSNDLIAFWTAEATRLAASASGTDFTADNTTEELTATSHGFVTGDGPFLVSNAGGALPTGLADDVLYWVLVVDDDTLQLYTGDRESTTQLVSFTTDGTGTHTLTRASTVEALFHLNRAHKPETIAGAADIDEL